MGDNGKVPGPSRARASTIAVLAAVAWMILCPGAGVRAQELRLDLSSRLRYDRDNEGSDWDALFYSNISVKDVIKDRLDLKLSGWGLWDIDADDSFDAALDSKNVRISEAYLDFKNLGALSRARIGRQYLYDFDNLHFDGATLRFFEEKPIGFRLYGGRAVTYYESAEGDWFAGGGVTWKPSWRTTHHLDVYAARQAEEVFALSAWRWNQLWPMDWRTLSRLRFIDAEIRDYRLLASKYIESLGLGVDMNFYIQPEDRGRGAEARTRTFSAFGNILGRSFPNYFFSLNLHKFFGQHYMAQVGGSIRRRFEDGEDGSFASLESNSANFTVTRFNTFIENFDVTIGGEGHANEQDNFFSLIAHANYRPSPEWEFSFGTSYSRYRFDPIDFETTLNDQDDVDLLITDLRTQTYFLEARWRPSPTYDFRAEVSYQNTDELERDGLTARLGFHYYFRRSLDREDAP